MERGDQASRPAGLDENECGYDMCTCATAPVLKNASRFCSDLCADAADLVTTGTTLCPCLHQGCESNGEKAMRPEERPAAGTATR